MYVITYPLPVTSRHLWYTIHHEAWHTASDDNSVFDWQHRLDTPLLMLHDQLAGGVVAIIFRNKWKSAVIPLPACTTFEALAVRLSLGAVYFTILLVNWPGSEEVSSLFYDELSTILETFPVLACICGDFNVKIQLADDSGARRGCMSYWHVLTWSNVWMGRLTTVETHLTSS